MSPPKQKTMQDYAQQSIDHLKSTIQAYQGFKQTLDEETIMLQKLLLQIEASIQKEEKKNEQLQLMTLKMKEETNESQNDFDWQIEDYRKEIHIFETQYDQISFATQAKERQNEQLQRQLIVATAQHRRLQGIRENNQEAIKRNQHNITECKLIEEDLRQKQRQMEDFIGNSEEKIKEIFELKKRLNNQLQEEKGNIRVYCRVRPPNNPMKPQAVHITSEHTLSLLQTRFNIRKEQEEYLIPYCFDHVFDKHQSQHQVFQQVSQVVQAAVDGRSVCIFAYGQTGSGKTHTLLGPRLDPGIASRSFDLIFQKIIQSRKHGWNYEVYLSVQEIYLEKINDLIKKQESKMDNILEVMVEDRQEIEASLIDAMAARKMASTSCNDASSRSHLIITIRLEGYGQEGTRRKGALSLVDLAGSERLKESKAEGDTLQETKFINRSLTQLSNVINSMHRKDKHVNFRNSKLTQVLKKYLEGESYTLMLINISPEISDAGMTKNTLTFGQEVKDVKPKK